MKYLSILILLLIINANAQEEFDDSCRVKGEKAPQWVCVPFCFSGICAYGSSEAGGEDMVTEFEVAKTYAIKDLENEASGQFKKQLTSFIDKVDSSDIQLINNLEFNIDPKSVKEKDTWKHPQTQRFFLLVLISEDELDTQYHDTIKNFILSLKVSDKRLSFLMQALKKEFPQDIKDEPKTPPSAREAFEALVKEFPE